MISMSSLPSSARLKSRRRKRAAQHDVVSGCVKNCTHITASIKLLVSDLLLTERSPILHEAKCSLVPAMCELPVEPSSDTGEEELLHQDIFKVFLDVEEYLTGEEIERVGLCCHFSLDCLCENVFCFVWPSPFTRLVNMRFPARNDPLRRSPALPN